ncbi:hypothetical protein KM043_015327 [Ampulex compressa]|nr:hypothetical protein KM043_015327 [Ampulex compressa]
MGPSTYSNESSVASFFSETGLDPVFCPSVKRNSTVAVAMAAGKLARKSHEYAPPVNRLSLRKVIFLANITNMDIEIKESVNWVSYNRNRELWDPLSKNHDEVAYGCT